MPLGRSIAAFAVKFLVLFGTLAASWPLCGRAYALFLRESGIALFETVGARDKVRFRAITAPEDEKHDTLVMVRQGASTNWIWTKASSWHVGFLSTSLLVALTLATPLGWRRRLWALVGGLVVLDVFVLVRLSMLVVCVPMLQMRGTFWTRVFVVSVMNFAVGPAVSCFVPVLIWIAVTVRREDVGRLVGSTQKSLTAQSPPRV